MGLLNTLNCRPKGKGNTAVGDCPVEFNMIKGFILTPSDAEISFTDIAALKTAINNALLLNDPYQRYYPVTRIAPNADNTEDTQIFTYADGSKQALRPGDYDYTFDLKYGKFCLLHRLRKHNSSGERALLIVEGNNGMYLLGTQGSTETSIKGIALSFFDAQTVRFQQGTDAPTGYRVRIAFEPTQINDNPSFVYFTGDPYLDQLKGIQDVKLTKVSRAVNVLTVKAITSCGTVDLYDAYSTQLAAVAAWKASTPGGADLTITSVTASANNKAFVITISTADPDYVAGQDIIVQLAGPTDLKALNVIGFESDALTVSV